MNGGATAGATPRIVLVSLHPQTLPAYQAGDISDGRGVDGGILVEIDAACVLEAQNQFEPFETVDPEIAFEQTVGPNLYFFEPSVTQFRHERGNDVEDLPLDVTC